MSLEDAIAIVALVVMVVGGMFWFLWSEIVRVRDKVHKMAPTDESLKQFIQFMKERPWEK